MTRIVLTYGIIAGLFVSVMLLISFSTNIILTRPYGELFGYTTMIVSLSSIFFAVRSYRDNELGGQITFWTALKMGLFIAFIASTVYVLSWLLISNSVGKDFMANYISQTVEELHQSNLSEQEIQLKINEMEHFQELYKIPIVKIGITYLEILPVGIVVSLICALILRRNTSA